MTMTKKDAFLKYVETGIKNFKIIPSELLKLYTHEEIAQDKNLHEGGGKRLQEKAQEAKEEVRRLKTNANAITIDEEGNFIDFSDPKDNNLIPSEPQTPKEKEAWDRKGAEEKAKRKKIA